MAKTSVEEDVVVVGWMISSDHRRPISRFAGNYSVIFYRISILYYLLNK